MLTSTTNVNTYLNHATSTDLLKFYQAHGGRTQIMALPICPKCEKLGFRDKGWATHRTMICPICGYHGPATHQLAAYLNEGQYK